MKYFISVVFLAGMITVITLSCNQVPNSNTDPATPDDFTPVIGAIIGQDSAPVKGSDGRWHVVYELLLTNAKAVTATLQKITVVAGSDSSRILATFEEEDLVKNLRTLGSRPVEDNILEPNSAKFLFVGLVFDKLSDVPASVKHRIEGLGAGGPAATDPTPIDYVITEFTLDQHTAPTLSPPLQGSGWIVLNGCCSTEGAHRTAIQTVNGILVDSQRFAIDWMQVDNQGRLFVGEESVLENWVGYGKPVFATASGVVTQMENNLPDQVPGTLPDPNSINLNNVDGNHVVIDHGGSLFTFYAHLQPGSVGVNVGDSVQTGDQLGLLGNTGNTSAPHMHLHIMTGPSPLGSDGIPFVFDGFSFEAQTTLENRNDALDGAASLPTVAERINDPRQNELPLDLTIISFSE